jgi:hypothetical protein
MSDMYETTTETRDNEGSKCSGIRQAVLTLSDPTSDLVRQYDFPVLLRCRKTSDTVFVAFSRCRSLSDAFPHVVRTLANR